MYHSQDVSIQTPSSFQPLSCLATNLSTSAATRWRSAWRTTPSGKGLLGYVGNVVSQVPHVWLASDSNHVTFGIRAVRFCGTNAFGIRAVRFCGTNAFGIRAVRFCDTNGVGMEVVRLRGFNGNFRRECDGPERRRTSRARSLESGIKSPKVLNLLRMYRSNGVRT